MTLLWKPLLWATLNSELKGLGFTLTLKKPRVFHVYEKENIFNILKTLFQKIQVQCKGQETAHKSRMLEWAQNKLHSPEDPLLWNDIWCSVLPGALWHDPFLRSRAESESKHSEGYSIIFWLLYQKNRRGEQWQGVWACFHIQSKQKTQLKGYSRKGNIFIHRKRGPEVKQASSDPQSLFFQIPTVTSLSRCWNFPS